MPNPSDPVTTPDTPAHGRVTTLLTAVEQGLEATVTRSNPPAVVDVELLLAVHARRIHGGHSAAVHETVRDALKVLGQPEPLAPADLLKQVRAALSSTGGA